jgi:hypothetical protein
MVRTLAGQRGVTAPYSDGIGSAATFYYPLGVALDSSGSFALVVSKDYGWGVELLGPCILTIVAWRGGARKGWLEENR